MATRHVGNLVSITDANQHTTRWSYNAWNLIDTKTFANGTVWSYTYDSDGRVISRRFG